MKHTAHYSVEIRMLRSRRVDGGLRVTSTNLRGLHLSAKEPESMWAMIPLAVEMLLERNPWPPKMPFK